MSKETDLNRLAAIRPVLATQSESVVSDAERDAMAATIVRSALDAPVATRSSHTSRPWLVRGAVGTVAAAALVVIGTLAIAGHSVPAKQLTSAPSWKLVSNVTPAWLAVAGSGYEPSFHLTCPASDTCYAADTPSSSANTKTEAVTFGLNGTLSSVEVTTDAGASWVQSTLPETLTDATTLSCVNAVTCSLFGIDRSGSSALLETANAGATWSVTAGPSELTSAASAVTLSCASARTCVVLSSDPAGQTGASMAFSTQDGGTTWVVASVPTDFVPSSLDCVSTTSCVATGFFQSPVGSASSPTASVLFSTTGGATWQIAATPSGLGPRGAVSCASATTCVASFFGPNSSTDVVTSTDAGATWSATSGGALSGTMVNNVACPTSATCWAAGVSGLDTDVNGSGTFAFSTMSTNGVATFTSDGGQTWQSTPLPATFFMVLDISCPSSASCFALALPRPHNGTFAPVDLLSYGN